MLVLRRKENQWLTISDAAGNVLRIGVEDIEVSRGRRVSLLFHDPDHHFTIVRDEAINKNAVMP
jgi:sRNA-binding carbon storage regulator CsrA